MRLIHLLKISRLECLTDGIFAIAMTILVLDLRIPPEFLTQELRQILHDVILYKLLIYAGSFFILGTLWVAMNFQFGLLQRLNRPFVWTNIVFLMVICVVPFSASLVGSFPNSVTSIYFYAINLLCASAMQLIVFGCAHYYKLHNTSLYTPKIGAAVVKRVLVAPFFYVGSLIASYWHTHMAFILLILPTIIYIFPGMIDRYEAIEKDIDIS